MRRRSSLPWFDQAIELVLLLLHCLLPALILIKTFQYTAPAITNIEVLDTGFRFEIYMEWKFTLLLWFTGALLALFLYKAALPRHELEPSPFHGPLLLLVGAILLSLLVSPYQGIALAGFPKELRTGSLTWLASLALFMIAAHSPALRRRPEALFYTLIPFLLVNLPLTHLWFFGVDLAQSPGFMEFLYPSSKVTISIPRAPITSLGNQNYSSGLGGAMAALFLGAALLVPGQRRQWAYLSLSLLSFALTVASLSSSGFLAFSATALLLAATAWLRGERRQLLRVGGAALLGCALILGLYSLRNPLVWNETLGLYPTMVRDLAGTQAPPDPAPAAEPLIPPAPVDAPSGATGRFTIWKNTWELARQRPWFGWGLDTLAYTYPQGDHFTGREFVTDKPHSLYMDLLYGTGFTGLAGFGALVLVLLWQSVRYLWREPKPDPHLVGLLAGVAAYLVQGLVNDAQVGTLPLFLTWMGLSTGLLRAGSAAAGAPAGRQKERRAAR